MIFFVFTRVSCEANGLVVTEPYTKLLLENAVQSLDVEDLYVDNQKTKYYPNNAGYLFPNLKVVHNERNSLEFVEKQNFENMGKVTVITLAHNSISSVPADAFDHLQSVRIIYLNNNILKGLDPYLCSKNPNLVDFFAFRNQLETLPQGLFDNNLELEGMHFDFNKLHRIDITFYDSRNYLRLNFNSNACINKAIEDGKGKFDLIQEIRRNCQI